MTPPGRGKGTSSYAPSDAAREASNYFNALPIDDRAKLAPLLEHYRQMGIAEALDQIGAVSRHLKARIHDIRARRAL